MNLLIVDDESEEADLIEDFIKEEKPVFGRIYKVYGMQDAIAVIRQFPIEVLLCDLEMPGGGGLELTRWIRENYPEIAVIYVTGHAEFSYAQSAVRMDVVDDLLKPVEKNVLMKALKKAIQKVPQNELAQPMEKDTPDVIEEIKSYIRKHCTEDITRSVVANHFYMAPDHFSHIFKEQTGVTFSDYVTHARIEKSKKLLRDTELSIRDVALSSGYSSTAFYGKQFKRETGMTPKNYRHTVLPNL